MQAIPNFNGQEKLHVYLTSWQLVWDIAEVRKPKYGNGSTETEVRKGKYKSEQKIHGPVFTDP